MDAVEYLPRQAPRPPLNARRWLMLCTLSAAVALFATPLAADPEEGPRRGGEAAISAKLARPGDLTLRDTSLGEALLTISEIWDINLVVGAEVQGHVNGSFKDTPLREILDSILLSHGFSYRPVGQSLVVLKLEELGDLNPLLETATVPVRSANPADVLKAAGLFRSPRGKLELVPSTRSLLVIDFPDRVEKIRQFVAQVDAPRPASTLGAAADPSALDVATIALRFVKAESLIESCKTVLSNNGKAAALKSENQLVVSDHPEQLALVRRLVERLDVPRPQVRITALIYDIGLHDLEELGINWRQTVNFRKNAAGEPQTTLGVENVTRVPFGPGQPLDGAVSFLSLSRNLELGTVISALRSARHSRLLADPTVTVLNNELATIQIVQEVPYQELTQTTAGGNIGTTNFKEVGVKLLVTPQIAEDATIQMEVNPSFSRLSGFTPNTDFPIIDRRETNTHVRVKDGQTLVIGGLRQRADNGEFRGVPHLKDHRWIGRLFRGRSLSTVETELVVFLTPEVLPAYDIALPREQNAHDTGRMLIDSVPPADTALPWYPPKSLKQAYESQPTPYTKPISDESVPIDATPALTRSRSTPAPKPQLAPASPPPKPIEDADVKPAAEWRRARSPSKVK